MAWLWSILPILQLICIIHIIRHQRPWWWFLVVFFFPPFGAIAYILVEIRPQRAAGLSMPVPQAWLIRRAEAALRDHDTWENKSRLAELYARANRYQEAIDLLEPALETQHRKDPYLLFVLALAHVEKKHLSQASAILARIDETERKELMPQRQLLYARIFQAMDKPAEAEAWFTAAKEGFNGEEARCRHGLFLREQGRPDEAKQIFQRIVDTSRRAPRKYRREESEWISYAKSQLIDIERGDDGQGRQTNRP